MTNKNSLAEEAGVVLSKRGKVTAIRAGDVRILKRGDAVFGDEVVHTVRGANLQLKMNDDNIVMLRGGSSFKIASYQTANITATDEVKRFEYIGGSLKVSHRNFSPNSIQPSSGSMG